jgi:hypothetical protein
MVSDNGMYYFGTIKNPVTKKRKSNKKRLTISRNDKREGQITRKMK